MKKDKFVPYSIFYNGFKRPDVADPYTLVEYNEDHDMVFYGFGIDGHGEVIFNQFIGDSSQGFVVGAHLGEEVSVNRITMIANTHSLINAMRDRLSSYAQESFRNKAFEAYLYRYEFKRAIEYAPRGDNGIDKSHEELLLELERLRTDEVLRPNFTTVVYYATEMLLNELIREK